MTLNTSDVKQIRRVSYLKGVRFGAILVLVLDVLVVLIIKFI